MYVPEHFTENDKQEIARLVEEFPLATLVCFSGEEFIVNHIPMMLDKEDQYIGHVAKANSLHEMFPEGTNSIAIFQAETLTYLLICTLQNSRPIDMYPHGITRLYISMAN